MRSLRLRATTWRRIHDTVQNDRGLPILPAFSPSYDSAICLITDITSSPSPCSSGKYFFLAMPIPCSPLRVPPISSAGKMTGREYDSMWHRRAGFRPIRQFGGRHAFDARNSADRVLESVESSGFGIDANRMAAIPIAAIAPFNTIARL